MLTVSFNSQISHAQDRRWKNGPDVPAPERRYTRGEWFTARRRKLPDAGEARDVIILSRTISCQPGAAFRGNHTHTPTRPCAHAAALTHTGPSACTNARPSAHGVLLPVRTPAPSTPPFRLCACPRGSALHLACRCEPDNRFPPSTAGRGDQTQINVARVVSWKRAFPFDPGPPGSCPSSAGRVKDGQEYARRVPDRLSRDVTLK